MILPSQGIVAWRTADEKNAIDYMVSKKKRALGHIPNDEDIKKKLQAWIDTCKTRTWPVSVNVIECYDYVYDLLKDLEEKQSRAA